MFCELSKRVLQCLDIQIKLKVQELYGIFKAVLGELKFTPEEEQLFDLKLVVKGVGDVYICLGKVKTYSELIKRLTADKNSEYKISEKVISRTVSKESVVNKEAINKILEELCMLRKFTPRPLIKYNKTEQHYCKQNNKNLRSERKPEYEHKTESKLLNIYSLPFNKVPILPLCKPGNSKANCKRAISIDQKLKSCRLENSVCSILVLSRKTFKIRRKNQKFRLSSVKSICNWIKIELEESGWCRHIRLPRNMMLVEEHRTVCEKGKQDMLSSSDKFEEKDIQIPAHRMHSDALVSHTNLHNHCNCCCKKCNTNHFSNACISKMQNSEPVDIREYRRDVLEKCADILEKLQNLEAVSESDTKEKGKIRPNKYEDGHLWRGLKNVPRAAISGTSSQYISSCQVRRKRIKRNISKAEAEETKLCKSGKDQAEETRFRGGMELHKKSKSSKSALQVPKKVCPRVLWGVAKVDVYDDDSRTYEIMKLSRRKPWNVPETVDSVFVLSPPSSQNKTD